MHGAAIIGCGSIATAHAYGVARAVGIELVGLADNRLDAAVALGRRFGVPESACYSDFRQMLDEVGADVVIVALWHGQHAEATIAAASRGARLIICEKPMATSMGEAADMIVACGREGVKLAIAHQRRFFPGWTKARDLLAGGAIGSPQCAVLRVRDGLLNSATHSLDLARYILGDPATRRVTAAVQRRTDRFERGLRAEDSALALVDLDGGVRVFLESDLGAEYVSANAVITGSDGLLTIEENHVRLLDTRHAGWQTVSGAPFGTDDPTVVPDELARPLYELVAHFGTANIQPFVQNYVDQVQESVDWLDGLRDTHRGQAIQGYQTLEIVMSIYESARRRETVDMPLETRVYPLDLMVESGDLPVTRPGRYDIRSALVRGEAMSWA
jgi:predicted dehydrogenase